jgi:hypothetical protein
MRNIITLCLYRAPSDDFRLLVSPHEIIAARRTLDPELTFTHGSSGPRFNAEVTEITLKNGYTFLITETISDLFDILKDFDENHE